MENTHSTKGRDLACDIVASESFVDAVRRQAGPEAEHLLAGFVAGAEQKLKGREKKVNVWTFTNSTSAATAAASCSAVPALREAIFRKRRWARPRLRRVARTANSTPVTP